jgi:hypothetical protein
MTERVGNVAFFADRGLVLLIGVAVGLTIASAFHSPLGGAHEAVRAAMTPEPRAPTPLAQDCAFPVAPRLIESLRAGKPAVIGVFGDSFGDGVWAALYRRLQGTGLKVVKMSQEGVGFTRYQVVDLEQKAAQQLNEQPVDVAVIVLGANDTEGTWDDDHRHAYAFMTPQWQDIYGRRVGRVVARLREQQAIVYWIGLPKMRKPAYDSDVAAEDRFYADLARKLEIPYFDTRASTEDERGDFNLYLPDATSGVRRLMRTNDGVHMTAAGYERLASPLMPRIRAYLERAATDAGAERPRTSSDPAQRPQAGAS